MRLSHLFVVFLVGISSVVACGGGKDGGGDGADAAVDSPVTPDAPAGLTGLGQKCVAAMQGADCPSTAPGCLTFSAGATTGICTQVCASNGTFRTDANSQPTNIMPVLSTLNGVCTPLYTGTAGIAECNTIVNIDPAPPLQPNTNYKFLGVCGIKCGAGNTCDAGLTCNTATMACQP